MSTATGSMLVNRPIHNHTHPPIHRALSTQAPVLFHVKSLAAPNCWRCNFMLRLFIERVIRTWSGITKIAE